MPNSLQWLHYRLTFLLAMSCAFLGPMSLRLAAAEAAQPNIVFLFIDDMGWPDLACFGHRFHETPIIDRLASQGMKFTDFYAATPVCSSTRSTVQTGQYSARTGITDFIPGHWRPFERLVVPPIDHHLLAGVKTPGDVLQAAGYVTGYFGKWHLGNGAEFAPDKYGYQVTEAQLGPEFRRARGDQPRGPKSIDFLTDATLHFIEQNQDKPFFVTLSHHAVHIPVEANDATIAKYETKPKPETGVNHPVYAAMVEDLDASVGRILDKLDELKLSDNTIVVFTSDNGGLQKIYTGVGEVVSTNAPLRDEKGTLYEGGIRVPMIVRWPGVVQPGTVCDEPATTADLLPTFCEMASTGVPAQPIDGASLVPLLKEPAGSLQRDAIYFHYPHYHHSRPAGAIRVGDWKLIEFFDDGSVELYNLADDIGESQNQAAAQPELAARLQHKLAAWRTAVGARMPEANPNYDSSRAQEWWDRRKNEPLDIEAMRQRYETKAKQASQVFQWEVKEDQSVALRQGPTVLWQFNYGAQEPKPHFHPVALADGRVVTWNRPPDHIWHHGLWFSWKFLNGVNYWEPDASGKPAGKTAWSDVKIAQAEDGSAKIAMTLNYSPPDAAPILSEQRTIHISAPNDGGGFHMDWTCDFTAGEQDVVFDRTPLEEEPGGQPWGGYAGLSIRLAEGLTERAADSPEGPIEFNSQSRFRGKALAVDYHGLIDGKPLGVAVCDHPDNLNHPSPWYVIRSNPMSYFSPAVICYGSHTLKAGGNLKLQYRVHIHPGRWNAERLQAEYAAYAK